MRKILTKALIGVISTVIALQGITVIPALAENNGSELTADIDDDGEGSGTVSGSVSCAGDVISGATVTVSKGGVTKTTVTGSDGAYTVSDVPADTGYTVTVTKDGYTGSSKSEVNVSADSEVQINLAMQPSATPEYTINEDFSGYDEGAFNGGDTWTIQGSAGSATITADAENSGNKYLTITKNASGVFGMYNTTAANLSGLVTIEARVKRTKTSGQFSMYAYNASKFSASNPKGADTSTTFYLASGNISTHTSATAVAAPYSANQWYDIKIVANIGEGKGKFDFYVNGECVLINQTLRNNLALDRFSLYSSDNNADMLIDYFRVYAN